MKYTQQQIDIFKKNWHEINQPIGKMLGFPDCCINAFCNEPPEILENKEPTDDDKRRYEAACINGKFTGFIPCSEHAGQIVSGEITLASLISERDPSLPEFPKAFQQI